MGTNIRHQQYLDGHTILRPQHFKGGWRIVRYTPGGGWAHWEGSDFTAETMKEVDEEISRLVTEDTTGKLIKD